MRKRKGGKHAIMTKEELATRRDLRYQACARLGREIGCPADRILLKEIADAVGVRITALASSERRPSVDEALRIYIEAGDTPPG
jgi:hypothetical protein